MDDQNLNVPLGHDQPLHIINHGNVKIYTDTTRSKKVVKFTRNQKWVLGICLTVFFGVSCFSFTVDPEIFTSDDLLGYILFAVMLISSMWFCAQVYISTRSKWVTAFPLVAALVCMTVCLKEGNAPNGLVSIWKAIGVYARSKEPQKINEEDSIKIIRNYEQKLIDSIRIIQNYKMQDSSQRNSTPPLSKSQKDKISKKKKNG